VKSQKENMLNYYVEIDYSKIVSPSHTTIVAISSGILQGSLEMEGLSHLAIYKIKKDSYGSYS
jgi:hypothetical protein